MDLCGKLQSFPSMWSLLLHCVRWWFGLVLFVSLTVCKLLLHGEKRRKTQLFRHDFEMVLD